MKPPIDIDREMRFDERGLCHAVFRIAAIFPDRGRNLEAEMSPYAYINNIFRSAIAKSGGVVRRSVNEVEKIAGYEALASEVKRRGFHLLQAGGSYIIVCNSDSIRLHF